MEILLLVPSLDVERYKGLAKVSLELYKRIEKRFDVEVFEVHGEKRSYWKNITITPLKCFFSKAKIIHSTVPDSGSLLFLKKTDSFVTFHDFVPLKMAEELDFKHKRIVHIYTNFMWRLASKSNTICNSSQTAQELLKYFGKKSDYIINPGIDKELKPMKVHKDKVTLGFFSNWSFRKRVNIAIDVFKILKKDIDCRLLLAGGEITSSYQQQFDVPKLIKGLVDVQILGNVSQKYVVKLYNSFDFFLFPSVHEGFGLPILEAQACGILTFVLSNAEIPNETKKFAVKCKDAKDMANKIKYYLENKKEKKNLQKRAMEYAKGFSWDRFAEEHIKIYEKHLSI